MASLGERVKHERERRRYSQQELAKEAGITQGLLSRIETGKVMAPNAEVVRRLARALWVTTDHLLCMDLDDETGQREPTAGALVGA
jgi:transcriptional regulator with XRE-family HTH domain